jgi:hypothetical protein
VSRPQFSALFCQRFNCHASEYEERVFNHCLYWHAKLLAPVLRVVRPNFFAEDLKFIRYLGASTGVREAEIDLLNFRDANAGRGSFLRTNLKIRVSGRKAGRLAQRLFAEERRVDAKPD